MDALDILANNLANVNTSGFKEQKSFFTVLSDSMSPSASMDTHPLFPERSIQANGALSLADGSLRATGRELDIALVGQGFLEVATPRGVRYTRNGNLSVDARSQLTTSDGLPILGENGPIVIEPGTLNITEQGEVYVNRTRVDRLKIAAPDNPGRLALEGHSLLAPADPGAKPKAGSAVVRQGFLEQSNVNAVSAVIEMVAIMRRFEAIQKTVNLMLNDIDAKSIEKLGR